MPFTMNHLGLVLNHQFHNTVTIRDIDERVKRIPVDHFTVVGSVTWSLNGSKAAGNL